MIQVVKVNKSFRQLLIAYNASILVDSIVFMTILKYLEEHSEESSVFTLFYLLFYLPAALFSLPIGGWVEKNVLQKVMMGSILLRIIFMVIFISLFNLGSLFIILSYICIEATLALFFLPANDALVPYIVEKEMRPDANALIKLLYVITRGAGFTIAVLLLQTSISYLGILLLCILLLIVSLLYVRKIRPYIKNYELEQSFWILTKEGLLYLRKRKATSQLFLVFAAAWLVASSIDIVIINYLLSVAEVSSEYFGFIAGAVYAGMIIGAILAPHFYYNGRRKWMFISPVFIYSILIQSMNSFTQWYIILPFFFIGGVSLGFFEVSLTTYLQDETDRKYYARVFSVYTLILSVMPLPGLLFMGVWIEVAGLSSTINVISIFLFCIGLVAAVKLPNFDLNKMTS